MKKYENCHAFFDCCSENQEKKVDCLIYISGDCNSEFIHLNYFAIA